MILEQTKIFLDICKLYISQKIAICKNKFYCFFSIPNKLDNISSDITVITEKLTRIEVIVNEIRETDFVSVGR